MSNYKHGTKLPALTSISLTQSTFTTPSRPTGTPAAFQSPAATNSDNLSNLFCKANCFPPTKSRNHTISSIISIVEHMFVNCKYKSKKFAWDSLDDYEQAKLAFLILKNQHELLSQHCKVPSMVPLRLWKAVFVEDTSEYKALDAFVRKGGDSYQEDSSGKNYWVTFHNKHPEWKDNNDATFTLFTSLDGFGKLLEPFIRFQTDSSKVCYVLSAANAILYYMLRTTGTGRDEGICQYAINVGRFMRNCFDDEQVFQTIFCDNGGFPKRVLESLLSGSSVAAEGKTMTKPTSMEYRWNADMIFYAVKDALNTCGPIVVSGFRVFDGYTNVDKTEFSKKDCQFSDFGSFGVHAFLIVGVRKTPDDSMGGIQFLIQDSLPGRPFVSIGIDLFERMGVEDFVSIREGVVYGGTGDDTKVDFFRVASLTSGSPRGNVPLEVEITHSDSAGMGESLTEDEKVSGSEGSATKNDSHRKLDYIGFDGLDENTDLTNLVIYT